MLARLDLLVAELLVAGGFGSGLQALDKTCLVPDDAGGDPVREFLSPHQIAASDLERIDSERLCAHVHQTLGDEGRDRPADAAIGTGRRLAGRYATDRPTVGFYLVR